ncbi:unnamed protein product [Polarella glacialis]|uniref:Uncharacterized protein n=1 Tax=Polarella glacialis TaxID=89957 RepID=A0A813F333_POLGL|nr:unnamed protein product [Polarella glacialis]
MTVEKMMVVLRRCVKEDRISRFCPEPWEDYASPRKLELFTVLQRAETWLDTNDLLSVEIKEALTAEAAHHTCIRKIFFEAHNDWDEAIFCLKILCNTINGKSHGRCEHYTMWDDDGCGSTCKGTIRALMEKMLGTFTGSESRGYCAVMEKASFEDASAAERGKMAPNAQMANLKGSSGMARRLRGQAWPAVGLEAPPDLRQQQPDGGSQGQGRRCLRLQRHVGHALQRPLDHQRSHGAGRPSQVRAPAVPRDHAQRAAGTDAEAEGQGREGQRGADAA